MSHVDALGNSRLELRLHLCWVIGLAAGGSRWEGDRLLVPVSTVHVRKAVCWPSLYIGRRGHSPGQGALSGWRGPGLAPGGVELSLTETPAETLLQGALSRCWGLEKVWDLSVG